MQYTWQYVELRDCAKKINYLEYYPMKWNLCEENELSWMLSYEMVSCCASMILPL